MGLLDGNPDDGGGLLSSLASLLGVNPAYGAMLGNAGRGALAGMGAAAGVPGFGNQIGRGAIGGMQANYQRQDQMLRQKMGRQQIAGSNADLYSKWQAMNRYNHFIGAPQVSYDQFVSGGYQGAQNGQVGQTGQAVAQPPQAGTPQGAGSPAATATQGQADPIGQTAAAAGYDPNSYSSLMDYGVAAAAAGMPKEFVDLIKSRAEGTNEFLTRQAQTKAGLTQGADGKWYNPDGTLAAEGQKAQVIAGGTAAGAFPYDIAKQNNQSQNQIAVNRASPLAIQPGGAAVVYGGGGVGSATPRLPPSGSPGGPPVGVPPPPVRATPGVDRPPVAAATPAVTPAPAASNPNDTITGPIIDRSALGANSVPPPASPPQVSRLPDGSIVSNTLQSANLSTDTASGYLKPRGEALAKRMDAVEASSQAARDTLTQIGKISQNLKMAPSGPGADVLNKGAAVAQKFGWDINEILPDSMKTDPVAFQNAQAMISNLGMGLARQNFPGGRITNTDLRTAFRGVVSWDNLSKANDELIKNVADISRMKVEQSKFWHAYEAAKPGAFRTGTFSGKQTVQGALDGGVDEAFAQYVQGMPNIPQEIKDGFLAYSDYGGGNGTTPDLSTTPPPGASSGKIPPPPPGYVPLTGGQ